MTLEEKWSPNTLKVSHKTMVTYDFSTVPQSVLFKIADYGYIFIFAKSSLAQLE